MPIIGLMIRHRIAILCLAAASVASAAPETSTPISAKRMKNDDRVLSSDEFLGRAPGEAGEEKAINYIKDSLAKAGLEPAGDNGTWFQNVPLVRLDRQPGAKLSLKI